MDINKTFIVLWLLFAVMKYEGEASLIHFGSS